MRAHDGAVLTIAGPVVMSSIDAIALSGMNAALKATEAAGHNLANLETPGFRRQAAVTSTEEGGGVEVHLSTAALAANAPEDDVTALKTDAAAFALDAAVLRTHRRMTGALLDEQA
jgi:flagellar basal-body rod protein FlgC